MTTLGEKLREAIEKKQVQATLNAWDKHEDQIRKPQTQEKQMANTHTGSPHFAVTNNVMRTTFNLMKAEPNKDIRYYADKLEAQGYKEGSVTSVIYQLTRAGQAVRDDNKRYRIVVDEYQPIKAWKKVPNPVKIIEDNKRLERKTVMITRRKREDPSHGIAALKADTGLQNEEKFDMGKFTHHAPVHRAFIPSAIVDQLPVLHARELYDYLKKIFGGN